MKTYTADELRALDRRVLELTTGLKCGRNFGRDVVIDSDGYDAGEVPYFSTDHADAYMIGGAMVAKGLSWEYGEALLKIVNEESVETYKGSSDPKRIPYCLAQATPLQRALAAVAACEEVTT